MTDKKLGDALRDLRNFFIDRQAYDALLAAADAADEQDRRLQGVIDANNTLARSLDEAIRHIKALEPFPNGYAPEAGREAKGQYQRAYEAGWRPEAKREEGAGHSCAHSHEWCYALNCGCPPAQAAQRERCRTCNRTLRAVAWVHDPPVGADHVGVPTDPPAEQQRDGGEEKA